MTAVFECQQEGCEATADTPEEAIVHTATTLHDMIKDGDEMTMTISATPFDEDEQDNEQ